MKKILLAVLLAFVNIALAQNCNLEFDLVDSYYTYRGSFLANGYYCEGNGGYNTKVSFIDPQMNSQNNIWFTYNINGEITSSMENFKFITSESKDSLVVNLTVSIGSIDTSKCTFSKTFKWYRMLKKIYIYQDNDTVRLEGNVENLISIYGNALNFDTYTWYVSPTRINSFYNSKNYPSIIDNSYQLLINSENYEVGKCNLLSNKITVSTVTSIESPQAQVEKTLLKTYNLQGQVITEETKGVQIRMYSDGSREKTYVAP